MNLIDYLELITEDLTANNNNNKQSYFTQAIEYRKCIQVGELNNEVSHKDVIGEQKNYHLYQTQEICRMQQIETCVCCKTIKTEMKL